MKKKTIKHDGVMIRGDGVMIRGLQIGESVAKHGIYHILTHLDRSTDPNEENKVDM